MPLTCEQTVAELGRSAGDGRIEASWSGSPDPRLELLLHCVGILAVGEERTATALASHWEAFEQYAVGAATLRERVLVSRTLCIGALDERIAAVSPVGASRLGSIASRLARHPDPGVRLPALRARGALVRVLPTLRGLLEAASESSNRSVRRRALTSVASAPASEASWAIQILERSRMRGHDGYDQASIAAALPAMDRSGAVWALVQDELAAGSATSIEARWGLADGLRIVRLQENESADAATQGQLEQLLRSARADLDMPSLLAQRKAWEVTWMAGRTYLGLASPDPDDIQGQCEDLLFDALGGDGTGLGPRSVQLARTCAHLLHSLLRKNHIDRVPKSAVELDSHLLLSHAQASAEGAARAAAFRAWEIVLACQGWSQGSLDELAAASQAALEQGARLLLLTPGVHKTWQQVGLQVLGSWHDGARPGYASLVTTGRAMELGPTPGEVLTLLRMGPLRDGKFDSLLNKHLGEVVSRVLTPASVAGDGFQVSRLAAWTLLHTGSAHLFEVVLKRVEQEGSQESAGATVAQMEEVRRLLSMPLAEVGVATWDRQAAEAWERLLGRPDAPFRFLLGTLRELAGRVLGGNAELSQQQASAWLGEAAQTLTGLSDYAAKLLPDDHSPWSVFEPGDAKRAAEQAKAGEFALAPTVRAATVATMATMGEVERPVPATPASASSSTSTPAGRLPAQVMALVEATLKSLETDSAFQGVRERWRLHAGPLLGNLYVAMIEEVNSRMARQRASLRRLGPYELETRLASGGMGELWSARRSETQLGSAAGLFAVKLPLGGKGATTHETDRQWEVVRTEAVALLQLQHPNVVRFIDVGRDGSQPYVVMEFLRGLPLDVYLSIRLLRPWELAPIIRDACAGLAALHAQGMVHRDVKPANIYLCMNTEASDQLSTVRCRDPFLQPILRTVLIDLG
ncbi:MAG: protein kinase, partial [Deltaproteobacteria bacterium]